MARKDLLVQKQDNPMAQQTMTNRTLQQAAIERRTGKPLGQKPVSAKTIRQVEAERRIEVKPVISEQQLALTRYRRFLSDNIKLDTDEWMPKELFDVLSPEEQIKVKADGIKALNEIQKARFEAITVELKTGERISKTEFDKLVIEDQNRLMKDGIGAFNKYYEGKQKEFEATYTQLSTDEWVSNEAIKGLSSEDKAELIELGIDKFNKYIQDKVTSVAQVAVAQSQITAVAPKPIAPVAGTGRWAGFKGSDFVRTAQGEVPAWMLVPDFSLSFTPQNAPAMGTSYGAVLSNVMYPAFRIGSWQPDRYTEDMYTTPLPNNLLPKSQVTPELISTWSEMTSGFFEPEIVHKQGDVIQGTMKFSDQPWTEETYLAHLGITPEEAKKQILPSYQGVSQIYNNLFDYEHPYGLLDKDGNIVQPMAPRTEYAGGRWGAKVTEPTPFVGVTGVVAKWPESVAKAMPEIKLPGQWPTVVSSPAVLAAKLGAEELQKQIARGEIIKAKDDTLIPKQMFDELSREQQYKVRTEGAKGIVEYTAKGEPITSEYLSTLPEDSRKVLMGQGVDAYNARLAQENTLIKGQYIPNEFIANLEKQSHDMAAFLKLNGYDAYIAKMDEDNIRIPDGKGGFQWLPKSDYSQVERDNPSYASILKEKGYDAYIENKRQYEYELSDGNWMQKSVLDNLPKPQQEILKSDSVKAWQEFVAKQEDTLKDFSTTIERDIYGKVGLLPAGVATAKGALTTTETHKAYDIALASLAGKSNPTIQNALTSLFTKEQIDAATLPKAVTVDDLNRIMVEGNWQDKAYVYLAASRLAVWNKDVDWLNYDKLSDAQKKQMAEIYYPPGQWLETRIKQPMMEWAGEPLPKDINITKANEIIHSSGNWQVKQNFRNAMNEAGFIPTQKEWFELLDHDKLAQKWDNLSASDKQRALDSYTTFRDRFDVTVGKPTEEILKSVTKWATDDPNAFTRLLKGIPAGLAQALAGMTIGIGGATTKAYGALAEGTPKSAVVEFAQVPIGMVEWLSVQTPQQIAQDPYSGIGMFAGNLALAYVTGGALKGVRGVYRFSKTLSEGGILPRALKAGTTEVFRIKVPEGFDRLTSELDMIARDQAKVQAIFESGLSKAEQITRIKEILTPESRNIYDSYMKLIDEVAKFDTPESMKRPVNFGDISRMPTKASYDVMQWMTQHANDIKIHGSMSDWVQTNGVKGMWRPNDLDLNIKVNSGLSPDTVAAELSGIINKASGESTRVVGNSVEILRNGQWQKLVDVHWEEEFGELPYEWSTKKAINIDGVPFEPLAEQAYRRGEQIINPGVGKKVGLIGPEAAGREWRLKDVSRLHTEARGIVDVLREQGKEKSAKIIEDSLNFVESAPKGKPLPMTPENAASLQREFIDLVGEIQEAYLQEAVDVSLDWAKSPKGTLTRFASPSGKVINGVVYSAVRDIKPYVRAAERGYVEAGWLIDDLGRRVPAPREQIFASPELAYTHLADIFEGKIPEDAGVIAIRTVAEDVGKGKAVEPAFRVEYETTKKGEAQAVVLDELILPEGNKIYPTEPTELSFKKGSISEGLTGETSTRHPMTGQRVPMLWFATDAAKKAGLGAPTKAQITSMNLLAIKAAIVDLAYPHWAEKIKVSISQPAGVATGRLLDFYKETWRWKGKGKAEVSKAVNEQSDKLIKEATDNINKVAETGKQPIVESPEIVKLKEVARELPTLQEISEAKAGVIKETPFVKQFKDMDSAEFNDLAKQGKITPTGESLKGEVDAVAKGTKPAVISDIPLMDTYARVKGLHVEKVLSPGGEGHTSWIAVRKGNIDIIQQYKDMVGRYGEDLPNPIFDIEFGELLGYSPADVAAYIKKAGGYELLRKYIKPSKEGAIAQKPEVIQEIVHRGTDPEAIKVAEQNGLSFDGIQEGFEDIPSQYTFTVQRGVPKIVGATFYVDKLADVPVKLSEKMIEFGVKPLKARKIEPTSEEVEATLEADNVPIKTKLDSFKGLTEIDVDGNTITLTELKVKEGAVDVYVNGERVVGDVPLNYGDYIRIGDKGIAFIPKEVSIEGLSMAEKGFAEAMPKPEDLKTLEGYEKAVETEVQRQATKDILNTFADEEVQRVLKDSSLEDLSQTYIINLRDIAESVAMSGLGSAGSQTLASLKDSDFPSIGTVVTRLPELEGEVAKSVSGVSEVTTITEPSISTIPETKVSEPSKTTTGLTVSTPSTEISEPSELTPSTPSTVEETTRTPISETPSLTRVTTTQTTPVIPTTPSTPVTVTKVPPPIPTTVPFPVPVPHPKVVSSFEDLTEQQKLASIAWKSGWAFHLVYPPYVRPYVLHSNKPFPGVKVHKGPMSAYKSVVRILGDQLPDRIEWDLGIQDIIFEKDKEGKDVRAYFRADPRQQTTAAPPQGYPTTTTRRSIRRISRASVIPKVGSTK